MQSLSQVFTITFSSAPIQWSPGTPPAGTIGQPWSWQLNQPIGGNPPYSFSFTAGQTNPAGFTLSAGGLLSGTPQAASLTFFITVSDT